MERIWEPFNGKNYWKKRGYNLLDGAVQTKRRNMPVIQIRAGTKVATSSSSSSSSKKTRTTRLWRLKKAGRKIVSLKKVFMSPKNVWHRFRNGYVNMMLRMAGDTGKINGGAEFGKKRISQARNVQLKYKNIDDFEARIVLEIYRSLTTSKGFSELA